MQQGKRSQLKVFIQTDLLHHNMKRSIHSKIYDSFTFYTLQDVAEIELDDFLSKGDKVTYLSKITN